MGSVFSDAIVRLLNKPALQLVDEEGHPIQLSALTKAHQKIPVGLVGLYGIADLTGTVVSFRNGSIGG